MVFSGTDASKKRSSAITAEDVSSSIAPLMKIALSSSITE